MQGFKSMTLAACALALAACTATAPERVAAPPAYQAAGNYQIESKGPKKRVGIVDFVNKTSYGAGRLGNSASDILTTELVKTGAFLVFERQQLDKVLGEQALGQSGAIRPDTAAKAGELLGLQAIVTGSISQFGVKTEGSDYGVYKSKVQKAECTVDVRVIDTSAGQIIFADSGSGNYEKEVSQVLGMGGRAGYDETMGQEALRAAISKFMSNLVSQLASQEWKGKIAKVQKGSVVINAGAKTGLQVGDTLVVQELGEEVTDPDTGVVLGRMPGRLKGELQVIQHFGEDASLARVVSGSGFQRGDEVRLK